MKTKLLIQYLSHGKADQSEVKEKFWTFASEFLIRLANGEWHIIGHDFTPPPFRDKFEHYFRVNDVKYRSHPDGVSFELTTPLQIGGCLDIVNWTSTLVLRLEGKDLNEVEVPQMKKWLTIRAPDAWYEEREGVFPALCYMGISPHPAIDIRASLFTSDELLAAYTNALRSTLLVTHDLSMIIGPDELGPSFNK